MSILWQIASLLLLRSCAPGFYVHGIVGGKVSIPHSHPYMVYIEDSVTKNTCGGFLVRDDFVMTAANCKHSSDLMVYLGVNDTKFLPAGVAVEAFPHPNFNRDSPDYDIMLLKLKTPATLGETVNTTTWEKPKNKNISKDCMVLGWGWQNYNEESQSRVLREANVTLINSTNCDTAGTICTDGSTGPSMGDSGGPLICGDFVEGIVSYYTQTKKGFLTRYTHISHYLQWIENIIDPEAPTEEPMDRENPTDTKTPKDFNFFTHHNVITTFCL